MAALYGTHRRGGRRRRTRVHTPDPIDGRLGMMMSVRGAWYWAADVELKTNDIGDLPLVAELCSINFDFVAVFHLFQVI